MSEIKVDGLKAFAASVRKLDKEAAKGLKPALNECSTFLIAKTRPKIPTRTGRAAPYYPWLDFGGRTGRKKSVVRPFIKEGRYLYPTLGEHQAEFDKIMQRNLTKVAESAGLETR